MFKHTYIAKVGFVKTLDRTCPKDGGMYSSQERHVCPKCQAALVMPMTKGESPRPYLMTEVHVYPQERQQFRDEHKSRSAAAGGLEFEIRFILWGRYDKDSQTTHPDKRVQWLIPKRLIHLEFNTRPIVRPFHSTRDSIQKLELKYHFNNRAGDNLRFLDYPEEFQANTGQTPEQAAAEINNTTAVPGEVAAQPKTTAVGATTDEPSNKDIMEAIMGVSNRVSALEGDTPASVEENPADAPETPPEDLDLNDTGIVETTAKVGEVDPFQSA